MPIVTYILRDGDRREIDVPAGTSVMEAAIHGNVRGIDAECGGCLWTASKCRHESVAGQSQSQHHPAAVRAGGRIHRQY